MFLTFNSQEERRKYGGSSFMEIQYCKMPMETEPKDIVAVESVDHWKMDSLYIYEMNEFYDEYCDIFDCGIYGNLQTGVMDTCGINYYKPEFIDMLLTKILVKQPKDYQILVDWMRKAKEYNGFYILGV